MKENKLSDLIEALSIFLKYGDIKYPTHCEHDELHVNVNPTVVSKNDIEKLDKLGFSVTNDWGEDHFKSFDFGRF